MSVSERWCRTLMIRITAERWRLTRGRRGCGVAGLRGRGGRGQPPTRVLDMHAWSSSIGYIVHATTCRVGTLGTYGCGTSAGQVGRRVHN